jgi:hypothetical protein
MPLDYSTFFRAADPEGVLPGSLQFGLLSSRAATMLSIN